MLKAKGSYDLVKFLNTIKSSLRKNLIFVTGKGGVGKTAVSQAIALSLAQEGKRTLWVSFEDPTRPPGEWIQKGAHLWHFNCDAGQSFEEYAGMKVGIPALTRVFLHNKVIRYLAKAAPGIHELVLLGKVWHERKNYDHVVVDMPSTGYGLAMFQSTQNFAHLFKTGPLYRDASDMLSTFKDPEQTALLIVALPEEMPLRESLELNNYLHELFPDNPPSFWVNRKFPRVTTQEQEEASPPDSWAEPFAQTVSEYIQKRSILESYNLRLWSERGIHSSELYLIPFSSAQTLESVVLGLTRQLEEKRLL